MYDDDGGSSTPSLVVEYGQIGITGTVATSNIFCILFPDFQFGRCFFFKDSALEVRGVEFLNVFQLSWSLPARGGRSRRRRRRNKSDDQRGDTMRYHEILGDTRRY